jgi:hypothetical protein
MRQLNRIVTGVAITLSSSVMAYIPDKCDWTDCDALARGESSGGWGLIVLIIIGIIIFVKNK